MKQHFFGYVHSYDDPVNRTMVLQIQRTDLNMTGNIGASGSLNISGTTTGANVWENCADFANDAATYNIRIGPAPNTPPPTGEDGRNILLYSS